MQLPAIPSMSDISVPDTSGWSDAITGVVGDTVDATVTLIEPVTDRLTGRPSLAVRVTSPVRRHPFVAIAGVLAIVTAIVLWKSSRREAAPRRDDWVISDSNASESTTGPRSVSAA